MKMKGELGSVRAESVVLTRTEQILKGRDEVSRKQGRGGGMDVSRGRLRR